MRQLPHIFRLQQALQVLSERRDVLPAVGGATGEQLHTNMDEPVDGRMAKDDASVASTNAAEMAERNYRFLNPDIKAAATRLEKGQLILNHAVFREPVKIKFPMVAYRQPG